MVKLGLIGANVTNSLSPKIHKAFAKSMGIDISYELYSITEKEFPNLLMELKVSYFLGLNITNPFKQQALAKLSTVSKEIKDIGAINTMMFKEDDITVGANTDGVGFVRDIENNKKIILKGKKILLVGAGGAARGILSSLVTKNVDSVVIANRDISKAKTLSSIYRSFVNITAITPEKIGCCDFDLIINATSAGVNGGIPAIPDDFYAENACYYDINYGSSAEPFMAWANKMSTRVFDGVGMLVEQAAESWCFWFGTRPPTKEILSTCARWL